MEQYEIVELTHAILQAEAINLGLMKYIIKVQDCVIEVWRIIDPKTKTPSMFAFNVLTCKGSPLASGVAPTFPEALAAAEVALRSSDPFCSAA